MPDDTLLYLRELKYFAREARLITGSPMAKHMRVAVKSHAEYWTKKKYPQFRRERSRKHDTRRRTCSS